MVKKGKFDLAEEAFDDGCDKDLKLGTVTCRDRPGTGLLATLHR